MIPRLSTIEKARSYDRAFSMASTSCYTALMNTWESGRESKLLDDIIAGRKTVEGRLNKGKFAQYRPGDVVWLRRDYRDADGVLHDGEPSAALVAVKDVRHYETFLDMVTAEGFRNVIPHAQTAEEAANEYEQYYSAEKQARHGVLAIEIVYRP